jgi:ketosteroid isomerase-like protein
MIETLSLRQLSLAACLVFLLGTAGPRAEQSPDMQAVAAANLAFDKALSTRDIAAMEKVWAPEPYVITIDPGGKVLIIGWSAVRKSYEAGFANLSEISVSTREPQIHVAQNVAWVVGVQSLKGKLKNGNPLSLVSFSTNVYEKREGRWLLVLHTTSRVPH